MRSGAEPLSVTAASAFLRPSGLAGRHARISASKRKDSCGHRGVLGEATKPLNELGEAQIRHLDLAQETLHMCAS
jgi:hypothetical protein